MIQFSRHPDRRGVFCLTTEITLSVPRRQLFAFFADAGNLEAITPPWLNFRIVTEKPIQMEAGTLIDYQLRLHGIPLRWRTEIAEWEPPLRFVDRQLRGPYRVWEHLHEFIETETGTTMRDRVNYAVPGGSLVERWFVRPDLRRIFRYRNQRICERFEQMR